MILRTTTSCNVKSELYPTLSIAISICCPVIHSISLVAPLRRACLTLGHLVSLPVSTGESQETGAPARL